MCIRDSGYTVHNKLGSVKIMNELASYCRENTIPLFFDFDTVRFSSSGDGWAKTFDTAKGANGQTVYPTMYHVALRNKAADTRYVLLAREQLAGSAQKLISKTKKWEVEGFGLGTMSSLAYSDYGSRRTHSRGGMSSDIAVFMDTIHSSGRKLAVSEANAYAASVSYTHLDVYKRQLLSRLTNCCYFRRNSLSGGRPLKITSPCPVCCLINSCR